MTFILLWELIEPLLEQMAVDEVCTLLEKVGLLSKAQSAAISTAEEIKLMVESIKIYREYPNDPPGQTNTQSFTVGHPPE